VPASNPLNSRSMLSGSEILNLRTMHFVPPPRRLALRIEIDKATVLREIPRMSNAPRDRSQAPGQSRRPDKPKGAREESSGASAGFPYDAADTSETVAPFDEVALEAELTTSEGKVNWSPSKLSAYVPIFISVLALASSIYSAMETRNHNRLSEAPFTQFHIRNVFGARDEVGLYFIKHWNWACRGVLYESIL
jgi:hypothetical protein